VKIILLCFGLILVHPIFAKEVWKCTYTKTSNTVTKKCTKKIKVKKRKRQIIQTPIPKNRINILPGYGRSSIDVDYNNNEIKVKDNKGFVLGIGYSRNICRELSLGIQVFSNKDIFIDIGFHFKE